MTRRRPSPATSAGSRLFDRLSYVLLAVFVLATLGPALAGRGALIDVDVLTRYAPFSASSGVRVGDAITCRTDTLNYYLPGIASIRSAFLAGDFPTWAPYEVGGVPLASLPNHAALSPLSLPWFLLPLWLAPAFVKLLEIVVAVGGMFAFLRRHGVGRGAAVVAGIVFASSGFMMMWTNWPHTRVAALIPALFWALERTVQQRRPLDLALVALVVAGMLLGGFPAVTLFALTLAGAYVLARAVALWGWRWRPLVRVTVRAGVGVALGVGLAAIQLVPFALNLGTLGLEERDAAGEHLPLGLLLTAGVPDAVGLCRAYEAYSPVNPVEAVGFLGVTALVLAACALVLRLPAGPERDRSPRGFLGVALVVLVVLVWIGGPLLSAVQALPFYSTNSITRAQSVFGFVGAALAGIGLDRLRRRWEAASPARRAPRWTLPGAALALGAVGFAGTVVASARQDAVSGGYLEHWNGAVRLPAVFLAATLAVVLLTRLLPPRLRALGAVLLVALVVAQSTLFARSVLPLNDRANLFPETPTHSFLRENLGGERFGATGNTLYPAGADFYGLRTPVGHEFADPRWWDVLEAVDEGVRVSPTYSLFPPRVDAEAAADAPALDQLAVRYWVGTSGDVPGAVDAALPAADTVALGPGEVAGCEVDAGALRGIRVVLESAPQRRGRTPAVLHVAVRTPDGVLEGSRLLDPRVPRGAARVAVLGEDLADGGRYPVDVWLTGFGGDTVLRARADSLACSGVRPTDDGLRLVFAETGDTVYERASALPRVRWAARSQVQPDAGTRVDRLRAGLPDDLILLDDDTTPPAAGRPAVVRVRSDRPERMEADVDASGAGYLVVADAVVRDGWTATVDGRRVPLVAGNHAFAAVPVPQGEHRVVLSYRAPGLRLGVAITVASGSVVLGLLVLSGRAWRRGRARGEAAYGLP